MSDSPIEKSGPEGSGVGEPKFDLKRARRMCAELEEERDQEMAVVDALRTHAEDHDRTVTQLNNRINQLWKLISEAEVTLESCQAEIQTSL